MSEESGRGSRFDRQMSPAEALMWNVEKDPWLNPSGASLSIIDGQVDGEVFERWLRSTVAALPRLRERVVPGFGRLERPSWQPDPEFDFDYHYRHLDLAEAADERALLDYVGLVFQEPYDRTRPLWQVTLIGGLDGDRSALLMKLHHSIADGYGMARMQERFMVRDPASPVPDPVDLDAVVARTCAEESVEGGGPGPAGRALELATAQARLTRRLLARAALTGADPSVLLDTAIGTAGSAEGYAKMLSSQLGSGQSDDDGGSAGSPMWTGRSRHRHLEILRVPLGDVRKAAKALDASVNDVFMTGLINGAVAHHDKRDQPAEAFNTSFVVSTRTDSAEGGNSFTPVRVRVPAGPMTTIDRLRAVQERVQQQRSAVHGGGLMGGLAGVVNLLPTSLTTSTARSQASKIDFATTNVRSTRSQLWVAGQRMTEVFAPGPVAGSAMIASVISYLDTMHITLTVDPAAVTEPGPLRADVEQAFAELLASA